MSSDGFNGGGPPDPSMICLYPELQAAARGREKTEQVVPAREGADEDRSGPPDPSMICLYPELLRAAAGEGEKNTEAAPAGDAENRSGPPDPSMICLYPELLRAAAGGGKAEQVARVRAE